MSRFSSLAKKTGLLATVGMIGFSFISQASAFTTVSDSVAKSTEMHVPSLEAQNGQGGEQAKHVHHHRHDGRHHHHKAGQKDVRKDQKVKEATPTTNEAQQAKTVTKEDEAVRPETPKAEVTPAPSEAPKQAKSLEDVVPQPVTTTPGEPKSTVTTN